MNAGEAGPGCVLDRGYVGLGAKREGCFGVVRGSGGNWDERDEDAWCKGGGTDADVPAAFRGAVDDPT